ncbi:MAG TPA: ATP-binding protein [Bryobacteraceae bacterium]|jgi:signal transduction histidine kinase|nr:ATP-binding protein [Bryobacteraceae bacterium]
MIETEQIETPTAESALSRLPNAPPPTTTELRSSIAIFEDLPEEDLAWLASQMKAVDLPPGAVSNYAGDPADYMIAVLRGELRAERDDGGVYVARAGRVTGMLPFSRLTSFPATFRVFQPTRLAALHKTHFQELGLRLPHLQERLVNLLADRIRENAAADKQREKMMALGKLSAGLAHELNNPAAAARRAADMMRKAIYSARAAILKLDRGGLPLESRVFLAQMECDWERKAGPQTPLDSLERSDREDETAEWLARHNVANGYEMAASLVDLGCTKDVLESVAEHVPAQFLEDVMVRLSASFTIFRLADEIGNSMARISELVQAIKEYSYMDQMPEQEVDIHRGLENTLIMLRHKMKSIEIVRDYDRSLPTVCARGGELNQIWTNLIINAVEAMHGKGKLIIRTKRDGRCACVEVIDSGPGIPPEMQTRIFEPFFTTKPVGEGTGLGLDLVYRIAKNHSGNASFESRPGETRFTVRIPFSAGAPIP